MAQRNYILKLKQNNTGKVLSININQETVEKPNVPSGLGLWWKHPVSGQWIQNAQRIKDTRRIVDIANYYQTQRPLTIDIRNYPGPECTDFSVKYFRFGTDVNDSGELIRDPKILITTEQIDQYFRDLISIKSPLGSSELGKLTLNFRSTLGRDPLSMIPQEANITIFYIAITSKCGYSNIIPLDFSKIKQ